MTVTIAARCGSVLFLMLLCCVACNAAQADKKDPSAPPKAGSEPTAEEQVFIYLLNKARRDPPAYGKSIKLDLDKVEPRPALAVNNNLTAAARFRSGDMKTRKYFAHVDPDGVGPNRHVLDFGYDLSKRYSRDKAANNTESIVMGTDTAAKSLAVLIIDDGTPGLGHRVHLLAMDAFYAESREIGVGCVWADDNKPQDQGHYTIETARRDQPEAFITGVVYEDKNGNGAYDVGEGLAGVTVAAGGQTTTTLKEGGFALALKPGPIIVGCSKGAFKGQASAQVMLGTSNVHIEFISDKKEGIVDFGKQLTAADTKARKKP